MRSIADIKNPIGRRVMCWSVEHLAGREGIKKERGVVSLSTNCVVIEESPSRPVHFSEKELQMAEKKMAEKKMAEKKMAEGGQYEITKELVNLQALENALIMLNLRLDKVEQRLDIWRLRELRRREDSL